MHVFKGGVAVTCGELRFAWLRPGSDALPGDGLTGKVNTLKEKLCKPR